jgi:hypothetical protein
MQKLIEMIKNFLYEEYEVKIWHDADPTKITEYRLKSIEKLTSTVVKGRDMSGFSVELQVQTPFNYQVKKIH